MAVSAVAVNAQNANESYDIVYRNTNGRELMLDISRPLSEGVARPAIVFLCGNGWGYDKSINREQFSYALDLAVANGYIGVTVDYSSTVENPYHRALGIFPSQVYDVKSAIRFLRANAKRFDIDPSRIGVVGFSSGAILRLCSHLPVRLMDWREWMTICNTLVPSRLWSTSQPQAILQAGIWSHTLAHISEGLWNPSLNCIEGLVQLTIYGRERPQF
jgi:hypothetical protein